MKRAANLFEQVIQFENLLEASKKALRGKKHQLGASSFYFHLENEIVTLHQELLQGTYQPRSYHIFEITIKDPKVRMICSSHLRDRVVHHALCTILEPFWERRLIFDTYACRVGKGCHAALSRCQKFSRENAYYLKCDIRKFFQSVDHLLLKKLLRCVFKDELVLGLLGKIIDHPVPGNSPAFCKPLFGRARSFFKRPFTCAFLSSLYGRLDSLWQ